MAFAPVMAVRNITVDRIIVFIYLRFNRFLAAKIRFVLFPPKGFSLS